MGPNIRWSDHFLSEVDYEVEKVSLPGGDFTSHLVNGRFHWNWSNQWLTSTTVQYSNLDDLWGINVRLNYIYRTGDDLFVIFNNIRSPENDAWSLLVKFTHTFEL